MTQRFDELYIRRCEHQQIVAFYKKVVVHMYRQLKTMRTKADIVHPDEIRPAHTGSSPDISIRPENAANIVWIDFHRRARSSH